MRRKLPSTQTLACFEAAARHRSLTRAAASKQARVWVEGSLRRMGPHQS